MSIDSMLEPEFHAPYTTWSTKATPQNTDALLGSIKPVLSAAMRTYGTQTSPTLHTHAKLMALDAMKRYDPTKSKLRTHLMVQLQGLRRLAAKENQIITVPEQVALDLSHVREAENLLRDQLGRDPSTAELANHTNISSKRLAYIRGMRPSYAQGSFQRATSDGEDIYQPSVQGSNDASQWHDFVYHDLIPTDQVIMEHTLGLHGKKVLSNQDIAAKLGVSPGAISQRKAKLQEKLNLRDTLGVI